jgi:hypothetical protein
MRSDSSLDHEIRTLECRIRDRRAALQESFDELKHSAADAKARVRARATSPLVWAGALVVGFLVARFARRRPEPVHASLRFGRGEPQQPQQRTVLAAVLSAMVPIGLRMAQQSLAPLIARTLHNMSRRRAYQP